MDSLENSSDEEMPNRPVTRSESRRRWARNLPSVAESREESSSTSIPMTELSHDTAREQGVSQLHAQTSEPAAEPGPSCSYQPEPSTSANRNIDYSTSTTSFLRSLSGRVTYAERSRLSPQDRYASPNETFISLGGVYETQRPSMGPPRCRFCSQGVERGRLLSVCQCNYDKRLAHKECLLNLIKHQPNTLCESCGYVIQSRSTDISIFLDEMQRESSSDEPTSSNEIDILPRVHAPRSPETRFSLASCRFCLRAEGVGKLSIVCKCNNNSLRAHEKCLEMAKKKGINRCRHCGHQFIFPVESNMECIIEEPENEQPPAEPEPERRPTLNERILQFVQRPHVKWTWYIINGISIILYCLYLFIQSQNKKK